MIAFLKNLFCKPRESTGNCGRGDAYEIIGRHQQLAFGGVTIKTNQNRDAELSEKIRKRMEEIENEIFHGYRLPQGGYIQIEPGRKILEEHGHPTGTISFPRREDGTVDSSHIFIAFSDGWQWKVNTPT